MGLFTATLRLQISRLYFL